MKKYLAIISLILSFGMMGCTDSIKEDIQYPSNPKSDISISASILQIDQRLAFGGNENGVTTNLEIGDRIYLYFAGPDSEDLDLLTHETGNAAIFVYNGNKDAYGNGIFDLTYEQNDESGYLADILSNADNIFKAVLVGKDCSFDEVDRFSQVNTAPPASGTQKQNNSLTYLDTTAGVFKSSNSISFTLATSPEGKDYYKGSEVFLFKPSYSIVQMELSVPKLLTEDADDVIPSDYPPSFVSFAINIGGELKSFELSLDTINGQKWTWGDKLYLPIPSEGKVGEMSAFVNNSEFETLDSRSYFAFWNPNNDVNFEQGKVYTVKPEFFGGLTLAYLNKNLNIIAIAGNKAILTVIDETGELSDTSFSRNIRNAINARTNGSIGFYFPRLQKVPGTSSQGAFQNVKNLYLFFAPVCQTLEHAAFKGCTSLVRTNFSQIKKVDQGGTFSGCTSLSEIIFPECQIMTGNEYLKNCPNLTYFYAPKLVSLGSLFELDNLYKSYKTPPLKLVIGTKTSADSPQDAGLSGFSFRSQSSFNYRFKSAGYLGASKFANENAGPITLEIGQGFSTGLNANWSSQGGASAYFACTKGSQVGNGDAISVGETYNGGYWWTFGKSITMLNDGFQSVAFGKFASITIVPYAD